jgi:hypothetical protein
MAKERKKVLKQHRLATDESKKFKLEKHLQPTETYNPKTQTQCSKKKLKKETPKPSIIPYFIACTHMSDRLVRSHE